MAGISGIAATALELRWLTSSISASPFAWIAGLAFGPTAPGLCPNRFDLGEGADLANDAVLSDDSQSPTVTTLTSGTSIFASASPTSLPRRDSW